MNNDPCAALRCTNISAKRNVMCLPCLRRMIERSERRADETVQYHRDMIANAESNRRHLEKLFRDACREEER